MKLGFSELFMKFHFLILTVDKTRMLTSSLGSCIRPLDFLPHVFLYKLLNVVTHGFIQKSKNLSYFHKNLEIISKNLKIQKHLKTKESVM